MPRGSPSPPPLRPPPPGPRLHPENQPRDASEQQAAYGGVPVKAGQRQDVEDEVRDIDRKPWSRMPSNTACVEEDRDVNARPGHQRRRLLELDARWPPSLAL